MLGRYVDLGNPVSDHPINRGLAAWWLPLPNNRGGGTLFDLTGRYPGSLTNGPTWASGPPGPSQPLTASLLFDGSDDYVRISSTFGGLTLAAVTVSCWVRYVSGPGFRDWLSVEVGSGAGHLVLEDKSGATPALYGVGSLSAVVEPASPALSSGWVHLTATTDGTTWWLYGNGGQSAASGLQTSSASVTALTVGARESGSRFTNSHVGDVRLYGRTLSAQDAAALYDQSLRGHPDTLRRFSRRVYLFSESSAGGTTFTQDHAGSCTSSGTLTKTVSKAVSGSSTPSGALTKSVSKPLAGSSTPTGALTPLTQKAISGSVTPSGMATKSSSKGTSGSCTSTADLAKLASKTSSGSSEPSGTAQNIKVALQSVGGSLTPSGAYTALTGKLLSGSITPTADATKIVGKLTSGSATPSGTESHLKVAIQSLSGSLTPSAAVTELVLKSLTGSMTATGQLSSTGGTPATVIAAVFRHSAAFARVRGYSVEFAWTRRQSAAFPHVRRQEGRF